MTTIAKRKVKKCDQSCKNNKIIADIKKWIVKMIVHNTHDDNVNIWQKQNYVTMNCQKKVIENSKKPIK